MNLFHTRPFEAASIAVQARLHVHLVEGYPDAVRLDRIRTLAFASRRAPLVFADLPGAIPASPLDWLIGPGCSCCLPADHPRARLARIAQAGPAAPRRVLIDAGTPPVCDLILAALRAMPFSLRLNVLTT